MDSPFYAVHNGERNVVVCHYSFVPSSTGLPSKRCPGIGFFSRVGREIGVFRHVTPPTTLCLEFPRETGLILRCARNVGNDVVFLEFRRDSRVTKGISDFLLCWPREAQSSIRVARESWGLRSSHCRAKETSSRLVSRT